MYTMTKKEASQLKLEYFLLHEKVVDLRLTYLEKISKNIIHNAPKENEENTKERWDEITKTTVDTIYDCLTDVYSMVSKFIKRVYGITWDSPLDMEELMFHEDGKTLDERVGSHIFFLDFSPENRSNDIIKYLSKIRIIIVTESMYLFNHFFYEVLKTYVDSYEIDNPDEVCDTCEPYYTQGRTPIENLGELPPYHPDCECFVVYYLPNGSNKYIE